MQQDILVSFFVSALEIAQNYRFADSPPPHCARCPVREYLSTLLHSSELASLMHHPRARTQKTFKLFTRVEICFNQRFAETTNKHAALQSCQFVYVAEQMLMLELAARQRRFKCQVPHNLALRRRIMFKTSLNITKYTRGQGVE